MISLILYYFSSNKETKTNLCLPFLSPEIDNESNVKLFHSIYFSMSYIFIFIVIIIHLLLIYKDRLHLLMIHSTKTSIINRRIFIISIIYTLQWLATILMVAPNQVLSLNINIYIFTIAFPCSSMLVPFVYMLILRDERQRIMTEKRTLQMLRGKLKI